MADGGRKRKLELGEDDSTARDGAPPFGATAGGGINPYTGRPYSQRYYEILAKRQGGLPRPAARPAAQPGGSRASQDGRRPCVFAPAQTCRYGRPRTSLWA